MPLDPKKIAKYIVSEGGCLMTLVSDELWEQICDEVDILRAEKANESR